MSRPSTSEARSSHSPLAGSLSSTFCSMDGWREFWPGKRKTSSTLNLPLAEEAPAAHCGYEHVLEDLQRLVEVRTGVRGGDARPIPGLIDGDSRVIHRGQEQTAVAELVAELVEQGAIFADDNRDDVGGRAAGIDSQGDEAVPEIGRVVPQPGTPFRFLLHDVDGHAQSCDGGRRQGGGEPVRVRVKAQVFDNLR